MTTDDDAIRAITAADAASAAAAAATLSSRRFSVVASAYYEDLYTVQR